MYSLFKEIWKNPGPSFSPVKRWKWECLPDDSSIREHVNSLMQKGIGYILLDTFDIPEVELFGKEYYLKLGTFAKCCALRNINIIYGINVRKVAKSNKYGGAYRLELIKEDDVSLSDDIVYRFYLKTSNGIITGSELSEHEGYEPYVLVLRHYDGLDDSAVFSDELSGGLVRLLKELKDNLVDYVGKTITGVYFDSLANMEHNCTERHFLPSDYDFMEHYMEFGGEVNELPLMFFETQPRSKKKSVISKYKKSINAFLYNKTISAIEKSCKEYNVSPYTDLDNMNGMFTSSFICGLGIESREDYAQYLKYISDMSRHSGINESFLFFSENSKAEEIRDAVMISSFNGCNKYMLPDGICQVLENSQSARYFNSLKRIMWLNSINSNNPKAAVLCDDDYVPYKSCEVLLENGIEYNYLSLSDFMKKALIEGGKILIDRYEYNVLLIDGRVQLSAESVKKIGLFMTAGGKCYRNGFSEFIETVKDDICFDGDIKNIRMRKINKSGCDFVSIYNFGQVERSFRMISKKSCRADLFDIVTGETESLSCRLTDSGFEYDIVIGPDEILVLGFDPDSLPDVRKENALKRRETISFSKNESRFSIDTEYRKVRMTIYGCMTGAVLSVNDHEHVIPLAPFSIDITSEIKPGENLIGITESDVRGIITIFDN